MARQVELSTKPTRWMAGLSGLAMGITATLLMWPRSCISTLIEPLDPSRDPNVTGCTSIVGLPTTKVVALGIGVAVGLLTVWIVSKAASRRSQS